MTRTGRPPRLNAEVIAELEKLIGAGLSTESACGVAGIPFSTFNHWLQLATNGRGGLYRELSQAITRARGKAEAIATRKIAGSDDWRGAAWWLSHNPHTRDRWSEAGAARKLEADIMARVVAVVEGTLTDAEQRRDLLLALAAAGLGTVPAEVGNAPAQ